MKKSKSDIIYPEGHFLGMGFAFGIPLGIPLGMLFGVMIENIALGISIGPAFGCAFGVILGGVMESKYKRMGLIQKAHPEDKIFRRRRIWLLLFLIFLGVLTFFTILYFSR